jgi:hypothetical protein
MIRKGTRVGRPFVHRLQKAVDPETKWYFVRPNSYGSPPLRPSDEEKIRGRSAAEKNADDLGKALGIEHVIHETTSPRRYRGRVSPAKPGATKRHF